MIAPKLNLEPAATHLIADLAGVPSAHLRDPSLLGGLLIAAASGAGLVSIGAPVMRRLPDEAVAGVLMLDGCHIALHSLPEREILLVDVLTLGRHDTGKALDVFVRRLRPREVRSETHFRG